MGEMSLDSLRKQLINPSKDYRSVPFWGWNDKLETEELKQQLKGMQEVGMGGVFIHSREGLETAYLSEEWMEAVQVTVQEAEEMHTDVWLYDEDKWPSGSAGGLVSKINPEKFTAKGITLQILRNYEEGLEGDYTALFKARINNKKILKLERCASLTQLAEEEVFLVLRIETSKTSEWYNGYAPSDNLNAEAVQQFMELTHEKYKKRVGTRFGKTIKGFFTDEPNCCDFFSTFTGERPWLPWTEGFEDYFEAKRGYNVLEHMPLMFYEGKGAQKIRHDYWRTVTERFSECYMKQLYDWCEGNKLQMTGHMLYENDMGYATRVCGAVMPHYRYMHAPGIDLLGEQTKEYLTIKQCTSVANQFGREIVVSETYGCTGWDFTFEGQKWLGDWQYVLGVNLRCQHLALYSIKGCRKRDYPPVFNYQAPWWKYNHVLETYFARLSSALRSGKPEKEILLIHPASTIWSMCGSSPDENFKNIEMNMGWLDEHIVTLNKKGEEYAGVARMLLGAHYDFDFGDEIILEEYGTIENRNLKINKASYKTVIVPSIKTLFKSTVNLLEAFLKAGGDILWVGPFPDRIEGEKNNRIEKLLKYQNLFLVHGYEEMLTGLRKIQEPLLSIKNRAGNEEDKLLGMVRTLEDGWLIFIVNNDRYNRHEVMVSFAGEGEVEAYDLLIDRTQKVVTQVQDKTVTFMADFAPADSKMYFVHRNKLPKEGEIAFKYEHPHRTEKIITCLGPVCQITRTMPNVLVLDKCHYLMEGNVIWSKEMEVWEAQKQIRETMELQQIYYNGAPQRYSWIHKECEKDHQKVRLKFYFKVEVCPLKPVYLAVEKAERFNVYLNGRLCELDLKAYFIDKSIGKIQLKDIEIGENELILECLYTHEMELEDIYLTGDFGVSLQRSVIAEQETLQFGDWCMQGYMYYPGNMVYHFELNDFEMRESNIILQMNQYEATLLEVRINGQTAGHMMGKSCHKLNITEYLYKGDNKIDIEVAGSLRNMLGPFHQKYTGCSRISWADFRTTGSLYTPQYVLKPYGLYDPILLYEEN